MISAREFLGLRGMKWALGAALLGLVLCGWAWQRSTRVEPLPAPEVVLTAEPGALDDRAQPAHLDIADVIATDLFSPERQAPAVRYRMPGQAEPPAPPPEPVVLGITLGAGNTSFATCQLGSSRLIFARVGDVLGIYTVKSIERGKVVFRTDAGKQLEISALKPGS